MILHRVQKHGLYKNYYEVNKERIIDIIVDASVRETIPEIRTIVFIILGIIITMPIMLLIPLIAIPLLLVVVVGALKLSGKMEDARKEKVRLFAEEHWQESCFYVVPYRGIGVTDIDYGRVHGATIHFTAPNGRVLRNRLPVEEYERISNLPTKPKFIFALEFPRWNKKQPGYIGYMPDKLENIENLPIKELQK